MSPPRRPAFVDAAAAVEDIVAPIADEQLDELAACKIVIFRIRGKVGFDRLDLGARAQNEARGRNDTVIAFAGRFVDLVPDGIDVNAVVTASAIDDIRPASSHDEVVAVVPVDDIVAKGIAERVVAGAT